MSSLNGKAHHYLSIPKNINFSLGAGELAIVLQRWYAPCHTLICLILFNLGRFPCQGGSSSHGWIYTFSPACQAERTLNFAFLSLPPRSYLLVLEVVRPLSATDASPAARLIWIQGGNMDWSRLSHPPPGLRASAFSELLGAIGTERLTHQSQNYKTRG